RHPRRSVWQASAPRVERGLHGGANRAGAAVVDGGADRAEQRHESQPENRCDAAASVSEKTDERRGCFPSETRDRHDKFSQPGKIPGLSWWCDHADKAIQIL